MKKHKFSAESRIKSQNLDSANLAKSRNAKKGKRGFKRIYNAFFYSISGLKTAFCEEEAFRQIVLVSAILIPLGAFLGESFSEKVLLILPCVIAILAELANSAIENAIDFAGLEIHPFAKNAKDMGSAMQFIACAFMAGVWGFYLIERFL
ncbi:diacylglycerol kinase [Helicobacter sp. 23-1044]